MPRDVSRTNQFQLTIGGIPDDLMIQEVTLPDIKLGVVKYGNRGNQPDVKLPTKKEVGEMTLKVMRPIDIPDSWAFTQIRLAMSTNAPVPFFGVGFRVLSNDGFTSVEAYVCVDCFISEVKPPTYKREGNGEIAMWEIKLSMTDFLKTI
jgi:hypothetical protein